MKRCLRLSAALGAMLAGPWVLSAQRSIASAGALTPFESEGELRDYLRELTRRRDSARLADERKRCTDETVVTRGKLAPIAGQQPSFAIITGVVKEKRSGRGVTGAQVAVAPAAAATDTSGRFTLVVRDVEAKPRTVSIRTRAIGYYSRTDMIELAAGDSADVGVTICQSAVQLSAVVTSSAISGSVPSITNVQEAGVDEGGLVKLAGDYLIILRRGRLYSVRVAGRSLRPAAAINAFPPSLERDDAWYDELLVYRDRIVVIGYSYQRRGMEVGLFRLDRSGGLRHEATYNFRADDYYSSRNYASRLIGGTLIMYTPLYLDDPAGSLPAMRHWTPGAPDAPLLPIASAQHVYRPAAELDPRAVALHSIITCDLNAADLKCEATVVIGPGGRVTYASPTAMYLWTAPAADSGSVAYRIPFDRSAPRAIRVNGAPIDQFSMREDADGWLNALLVTGGGKEGMWGAERSRGNAALLRIELAQFGDGTADAPRTAYRPLGVSVDWGTQNRFVGDWLLFGTGSGWGRQLNAPSVLRAVSLRGGAPIGVELPHSVDRIEVMGADALVVGTGGGNLNFTGIRLDGTVTAAQRFAIPRAAQGELRSHGFFYAPDKSRGGVLGLPIRESSRPGFAHLVEGSASITFVRNDGREFHGLGSLEPDAPRIADDGCVASCVDWYGNARPIFLGDRILALLGYELVEGAIRGGRIVEVRRVSFQAGR